MRLIAALLILSGLWLTCTAEAAPTGGDHPWYELNMMADPILDQVLLFYLGHTVQGTSDIGECLATAAKVDPDDPWSWAKAWTGTADRLNRTAAACAEAGHLVSAGQIYLRAANYYQAALHRYPVAGGDKVRDLAQRAVECYRRGLELTDAPVELVEIPYENTTLAGYFFPADAGDTPAPTLIVHQGRDGWAEHCFFLAKAAVTRGYNCLLFDGPGQGRVLRLQGLPFRPDWENVVGPVVDFVCARPEVDPDRIGLIGLSMGGALAPRAAAFEKRLAVCAANPGVLSWADLIRGWFANVDPTLATLWQTDPEAFDARMQAMCAVSSFLDWGLKDSLWKHGVSTPSELMVDVGRYDNTSLIEYIDCPLLVMDGTADEFSQGRALYEALNGPKDYMLFTEEDTGLQHCQVGALSVSAQRLMDWLDENL